MQKNSEMIEGWKAVTSSSRNSTPQCKLNTKTIQQST